MNTGHGFPKIDLRLLRAQLGFWYMPLLGTIGRLPRAHAAMIAAVSRWAHAERAWTPAERDVFTKRMDPRVTQRVYGSFVFREFVPIALGGRYKRERLRPPTLFLHGAEDRAIRPDFLRGWEDHADDMSLELLPGLGHFCIEEAPEVVIPRMVHFLVP
jgi:pimeloyl-ACP methyl ester carboxylesterase